MSNQKDIKIKVFTAFSGYDSQCMALQRLKENYPFFDYELVGWSEIDEPAIRSHNANFPEAADLNYGDISKVDWSKVPDFDLFTYSSPCFIAGTKITVFKDNQFEFVDIDKIKVGDKVLTHTGKIKAVTEVMCNRAGRLCEMTDNYNNTVVCTYDHPFYCENIETGEKQWIEAKNIDENYFTVVVNPDREYITSSVVNKVFGRTFAPVTVYNLEVEDDHSYVANNFVVHNCTDFSICGKQLGGTEGSGTRSSLLWECKRTIEEKRPKFCILENVKALVSDKFNDLFESWKKTVDDMGYVSTSIVLNAADYDVPQGRERVFLVSVRIDEDDPHPIFNWPAPIKRTREIVDFLNKETPEDYYLDDRKVELFLDLLKYTGDEFNDKTEVHKHIVEQKLAEQQNCCDDVEEQQEQDIKNNDEALF